MHSCCLGRGTPAKSSVSAQTSEMSVSISSACPPAPRRCMTGAAAEIAAEGTGSEVTISSGGHNLVHVRSEPNRHRENFWSGEPCLALLPSSGQSGVVFSDSVVFGVKVAFVIVPRDCFVLRSCLEAS